MAVQKGYGHARLIWIKVKFYSVKTLTEVANLLVTCADVTAPSHIEIHWVNIHVLHITRNIVHFLVVCISVDNLVKYFCNTINYLTLTSKFSFT